MKADNPNEIYCPVCGRTLEAANQEYIDSGEHELYVFVHDDVEHTASDIDALHRAIQ